MSEASRFNLLKKVSGINWEEAGTCHFLTMTYPDHYYGMPCEQMSLHRSLWQRSFEKRAEKHVSVLWRTEHEVRKTGKWVGHLMPHVHMISFREKDVHEFDVWKDWMSAIGEMDYANVKVKEMESPKQVGYYVAKYVAKLSSILGIASNLSKIPPGRPWGILRRSLFPSHEKLEMKCVFSRELQDHVAKSLMPRPEVNEWGNRGFTLLGPAARKLWKEICELGLAGGETS